MMLGYWKHLFMILNNSQGGRESYGPHVRIHRSNYNFSLAVLLLILYLMLSSAVYIQHEK